MPAKIKKGDKVVILSGKDRGKIGTVERVFSALGRVRVSGIASAKKHSRRGRSRTAGIVDINQPISTSKVKLICSQCGKPTRVGFRLNPQKEQERYCKKCNALLT